jgi:hypothetical protein
MKVFTLGNSGFIGPQMAEALGLPRHTSQARVLVAAANKTAAHRLVGEGLGIPLSMSSQDFRLAMGNDLDALLRAGLLTTASIYVMPMLARAGSPVIEVYPGGTWSRVGTMEYAPGALSHLQFTPAV